MKKNFHLLAVAALACILLVTASASAIVSPALNVLSKQNTLIKSGLVYSDIYFSEQDFKKFYADPKTLFVKDINLVNIK